MREWREGRSVHRRGCVSGITAWIGVRHASTGEWAEWTRCSLQAVCPWLKGTGMGLEKQNERMVIEKRRGSSHVIRADHVIRPLETRTPRRL